VLVQRRGHAYDPTVVDAALDVGIDGLRADDDDNLWQAILDAEPPPRVSVAGVPLSRALAALGDYADLKLPERVGHARRVGRLATAVAEIADLGAVDADTLVRAALVHDVGMVAVPVGVWRSDPPPRSTGWEQIRLHPHWSGRVLSRCAGLDAVGTLAGRHHERCDGSGYPFGLSGELGQLGGLLACAVLYDELASIGAEREPGDVAAELGRLADAGALARRDVNIVLEAAGLDIPHARVARPGGLTEREVDVLGLLARGLTNREIAASLGISLKTVGAHVEHIYTKAAVRSRAAATLFAMQHDLLG
jgi:DNA-binding CsgD family transcriptional regulator